jgi:hypothetical protein
MNPNAIHLIERQMAQDPKKINWAHLSRNPNAIPILERYPEKIDWELLQINPNGISLIKRKLAQDPDKINWFHLSRNPNAIPILEKHPEKINWYWLSENPNAIHLLEKHPEKICWYYLSKNPSIFTYDYMAIKEHRTSFKEEIIQYVNSPKRLTKWLQNEHHTIEEFYELYG